MVLCRGQVVLCRGGSEGEVCHLQQSLGLPRVSRVESLSWFSGGGSELMTCLLRRVWDEWHLLEELASTFFIQRVDCE